MSQASPPDQPAPRGFPGKWLVIILVPVLVALSVWLYYERMTFKHPTNVAPAPSAPRKP